MNTFTFTDDEVIWMIAAIHVAQDESVSDTNIMRLNAILEKLERNPKLETLEFTEIGSVTDYGDLDPAKEK